MAEECAGEVRMVATVNAAVTHRARGTDGRDIYAIVSRVTFEIRIKVLWSLVLDRF